MLLLIGVVGLWESVDAAEWRLPWWPQKFEVSHQSFSPPNVPTTPADVDGDGNDEVLLNLAESELFQIFDDDNRTWLHSCRLPGFGTASVVNIDGDNRDDIWFSTFLDSTYRIYVLPGKEIDGRDTASWQCTKPEHLWYTLRVPVQGKVPLQGINVATSADLNTDGYPDLVLVPICQKLEGGKRGILIIDGRTRTELWHRWFGQWPANVLIDDLNGDGKLEVVVAGLSPDNGVTCDGFRDSVAYLFALTADGNFAWPPLRIGPRFLGVPLALLPKHTVDGVRKCDIVLATNSSEKDAPPQALRIISGATGTVEYEVTRPASYQSVRVLDLRLDGEAAIAVSTCDSMVITYDAALHAIDSLRVNSGNPWHLSGPFMSPPDSSALLLATCGGDSILFLNKRLRIVHVEHSLRLPAAINEVQTREADELRLVITGNTGYQELLSVRRVPKALGDVIPPPIALAIGSSFVLGSLVYVRQRRRYYSLLAGVFNDSDRIIVGLDQQDRIYQTNPRADEYFRELKGKPSGRSLDELESHERYGKLIREVLSMIREGGDRHRRIQLVESGFAKEYLVGLRYLARTHLGRKVKVVVLIQDVTELSQTKALELWAMISHTLAHDLKKPLAPLKLFLEDLAARVGLSQLDAATIRDQYVTPAVGQIEFLDRQLSRMGKIPNPLEKPTEPVDVVELLSSLVALKRTLLPKQIKLELVSDGEPIIILGFREHLERAFAELIENASAAVHETSAPRIRIECAPEDDNRRVNIRVRDNGGGIPANLLPRIFEPGVTSRSGDHKGLGMFTVFMTVTQHRGTIQVQSAEGSGTVFVITLPTVDGSVPNER